MKKDIFLLKRLIHLSFSLKKRIKFLICEEMWSDEFIKKNKSIRPDLLVVINASPYEINKFSEREKIAKKNVNAYNSDLIYLNHIGCQDELIFDGGSFFMNKSKKIIHQENFFVSVKEY